MTNKKRLIVFTVVFTVTMSILGFSSLNFTHNALAASKNYQALGASYVPKVSSISQAPKMASSCTQKIGSVGVFNTRSGYNLGVLYLFFNNPPCVSWYGVLQRWGGVGSGYDTISICNSVTCANSSNYSNGQATLLYSQKLYGYDEVCVVGQIEAINHNVLGQAEDCEAVY